MCKCCNIVSYAIFVILFIYLYTCNLDEQDKWEYDQLQTKEIEDIWTEISDINMRHNSIEN